MKRALLVLLLAACRSPADSLRGERAPFDRIVVLFLDRFGFGTAYRR